MTHFGIITPPVAGHIHPFGALGRELIARGHRVTCFHIPDLETSIRAEGLEFWTVGVEDHPRGSLPASLQQLARLKGLAALRFTVRAVAGTTQMICREGPAAIRAAGIDALLVDQMEPAGGALAEHLGLPFFTVCNALAMNSDPVVPPPFTPWRYRTGWWARVRNRAGYGISGLLTRPVTNVVSHYRQHWNLRRLESADDSFSTKAQICQMPRELDFPRTALPGVFHYVGPLRRPHPPAIEFPWERLDGRPMVYASLGTLQNRREPLFRCFAEACAQLNVQLVIAHAGGLTGDDAAKLPGRPLVVRYAPQLDVLARARLTITHGGLNTVLDSLASGVPIVMIPLTYEQPAIARRVEWTGSGQSVPLHVLKPSRLARTLLRVLRRPEYQEAAQRLRKDIIASGGVARAADILETTLERL